MKPKAKAQAKGKTKPATTATPKANGGKKPRAKGYKRKQYTDAQKAYAMAWYLMTGSPKEAERASGVNYQTIEGMRVKGVEVGIATRIVISADVIADRTEAAFNALLGRNLLTVPHQNIEQWANSVDKVGKLVLLMRGSATQIEQRIVNTTSQSASLDVKIDVTNAEVRNRLNEFSKLFDQLTNAEGVEYPPQPGQPGYTPEVPRTHEKIVNDMTAAATNAPPKIEGQ